LIENANLFRKGLIENPISGVINRRNGFKKGLTENWYYSLTSVEQSDL